MDGQSSKWSLRTVSLDTLSESQFQVGNVSEPFSSEEVMLTCVGKPCCMMQEPEWVPGIGRMQK